MTTSPKRTPKQAAWNAAEQAARFFQLTADYAGASSQDGVIEARWLRFNAMVANYVGRGAIVAEFIAHMPKGAAKTAGTCWTQIGFEPGTSDVALGAQVRKDRFGSVNTLSKVYDMHAMHTEARAEAFALDNTPNLTTYDTFLRIVTGKQEPIAKLEQTPVMVDGKHATHRGVKRYVVKQAGNGTQRNVSPEAAAKRAEAERVKAAAAAAAERVKALPAVMVDMLAMDVDAVLADPGFALDTIPEARRALIARGLVAWLLKQAAPADAPADAEADALATL